ncbi:Hydroxymethylglutaryl-CoA reductase [Vibrio cholerae]|nr:Hydroxymethylglutaryl-CoA reductase [Vibrio cholerae]
MEIHPHGGYTPVSPAYLMSNVGGGTHLPSQHACLSLMGLAGQGHAQL